MLCEQWVLLFEKKITREMSFVAMDCSCRAFARNAGLGKWSLWKEAHVLLEMCGRCERKMGELKASDSDGTCLVL